MKIAIEAFGIDKFGGGRTATLNLLESLFTIDHENEYSVFLTKPEMSLKKYQENVTQHIVPIRNRIIIRLWAQVFLRRIFNSYDLVHFVKNLSLFGLSTRVVVTVYDLTTLIHPDLFPKIDVWYWRHVERKHLHKADKIIAISHNTAKDITHFYHIPPQRIEIIYPAFAPYFRPIPEDEIKSILHRYNLPENYFIHVGRINRKKNLTLLLQAFAKYRESSPPSHYPNKLVLVGEEDKKGKDPLLHTSIEKLGLKDDVFFSGPVREQDLPGLFSGANATVFPSIHEGFGLSPIEAMACGSPLITHYAGALEEVVGDAAVILKSLSIDNLADALLLLSTDHDLHQEFRNRGLARAKKYQVKFTAHKTLELYRRVINQ
jgi:glycosyltransferase involved in cell wall biosynthesis